ncbi:PHP domain-containing protein [Ruminococcaceae bacterium OttesenSCG-928-I18]|nr:PHP domain-containing protein [Ruminococcaceae bacterium OttesenSCG-928-I18]
MILRSNAHTHTSWCDGANTPMEMAEAAFALGFTDLGLSSHMAETGHPGFGMQDEAGYKNDVARVKKAFEGRMDILCGAERDTMSPLKAEGFDYFIGSNHYLPPQNGSYCAVDDSAECLGRACREFYDGDWREMVRAFYDLSVQNIRENRPDIVGHFDLIKKHNTHNAIFDEESSFYRDVALSALDEVIDIVKGYGGMVEMNMAPVYRGFRDSPCPSLFLLRHLAQRDARVIITSDSHTTATLNGGFDIAPSLLQKAGFSKMAILYKGAFVDTSIEDGAISR